MSSVIGENSNSEYIILEEIGRGAQGRVFSIKGGNFAFKLVGTKSSVKAQLLKRKLSYIKTRNLQDLPISKPIELVKGEALGYIMEMATGMMPLDKLLKPESSHRWWEETGGLKKRFKILENLSHVLSCLHSRGLIYGDLSPSNIFISEDPKYAEVFLIDCDNITHESKLGESYYTPGYGAPEIINQISGSNTYSEYFSFSIIAYQLLTLNHPFIGDYVNLGDPKLEEKAYLCQIPWIEHTTDNINNTSMGINSNITISKLMMDEFVNTFEKGIDDKFKRTSITKWHKVFVNTQSFILKCDKCNNEFLYKKFSKLECLFCNYKLDYIGVVNILQLNAKIKYKVKETYNVKLDDIPDIGTEVKRKVINAHIFTDITENDLYLNNSNNVVLKIKIEKDFIIIHGDKMKKITVFKDGKLKENIDISSELRVSQDDWIIFSKDINSEYQRVLKVRKYPR